MNESNGPRAFSAEHSIHIVNKVALYYYDQVGLAFYRARNVFKKSYGVKEK